MQVVLKISHLWSVHWDQIKPGLRPRAPTTPLGSLLGEPYLPAFLREGLASAAHMHATHKLTCACAHTHIETHTKTHFQLVI